MTDREAEVRPRAEALLAKLEQSEHARLRIYIGAAPGVGKSYKMLEEAHLLKKQGCDVVIGFVETYGRADTEAKIGDLEIVPRKKIEYRGVMLEEMDLDAIIARQPRICVVDELAHTNVPGSKNRKRYEDVLDLLDAGIHVMTAVNIQHLETLNDAVARSSGIRVRETIPDSFLKRADEVVNVDVTVEELRTRLKQGKIYKPEKIEQALTHFFRKGNLSTLRELALRAVAEEVSAKAAQYRTREGLEPASIPENVEIESILIEEEVSVEVNPSQLQQVLLNLAVNARDAMPDGGRLRIEAIPVSVSPATAQTRTNVQSGRFVRVTVSDTGEGIPAAILPHIFEPFFTTKEIGKGTGLGLSVAYGIVKAHGGWIEVESQVGQGTSFHIYLPVAEQAGAEPVEEEDEGIVGGTETILLVEDEPTVRTLGRKVLEKLGYRVLVAQDGREAVDVYAAHQSDIDLVLLDVIMPQMSGQRAFEELRRLNPQVKILLVTGYSPGDVTEDLVLRGAQAIVQKPYDMKTLATVVRQCLDNMMSRGATP